MPYLTLKDCPVRSVDGEPTNHKAGTVLSDWEVEQFVKDKVQEGSVHYRSLLEPLTDKEAHDRRSKDTALEGSHSVDGREIEPPWDDYVGLHPSEVIHRMKDSKSRKEVEHVRLYEQGGQGRVTILEYVAPVERPPFYGYDDLGVRDVLEKLDVLSDEAVQEVISYEYDHRKRPAILTYERTSDDTKKEEVAA